MPFMLTIRERGNSWAWSGDQQSQGPRRRRSGIGQVRPPELERQDGRDAGVPDDNDNEEMVDRYFEHVLEAYEITERPGDPA